VFHGQETHAADAQLILQLYDLRREAEMRKARNWWAAEFWPSKRGRFHEDRVSRLGRRRITGCAR
jgi:hypothetical protein